MIEPRGSRNNKLLLTQGASRAQRSTTGFGAESCRDQFLEHANGIEKLSMQPLTGSLVCKPTIEAQLSPYDAWKASQNASAAEGNQLVDKKAR